MNVKLFPFSNNPLHFLGQVKKRINRILSMIGKNSRRKRAYLHPHRRQNRYHCHKRNPSYTGKVVYRHDFLAMIMEKPFTRMINRLCTRRRLFPFIFVFFFPRGFPCLIRLKLLFDIIICHLYNWNLNVF